eukprot:m.159078 g.159078  ORF g.159078 m.159078 type:complete len:57 (-) comp14518_c0_seq1:9-179(-)
MEKQRCTAPLQKAMTGLQKLSSRPAQGATFKLMYACYLSGFHQMCNAYNISTFAVS